MHAIDHFCMLARYNVWATQRLLLAIDTLDDAAYHKDAGLFFKSIHRTLNHMLVGEHLLWYPRFAKGISPKLALDMEAEPMRERLGQALKGGAGNWQPLIKSWPIERFDGKLSYTSSNGQAMSLPFAATLAHVFNHGTHHRGQITAALTVLGQSCPVLDLVFMLQEDSKA
jgi:uncharacterized damage-inducible protein DinB